MNMERLSRLLEVYRKAPGEFQATQYWRSYEKEILSTISRMGVNQLRPGKYPILGTFGFDDFVYSYHPYMGLGKKAVLMVLQKSILGSRAVLPYGSSLSSI
jgi:hypothetical protein